MKYIRAIVKIFGISRQQNITNNIYVILTCLKTNIKTIIIVIYCTVTGNIKQRKSIIITEIIHNQVLLSETNFYWKYIDRSNKTNLKKYKTYVKNNSYETVLNRQKLLLNQIDRVYNDHFEEFNIYKKYYKNLTWVMSTGRCGVDAIDNYFKKSQNHYSVHKEFDENIFFEYNSALTTKSYVFNKFLQNDATDEEVYKIIRKFLDIRIKTIEDADGKEFIFCEHNDTP